MSAQLKPQIEEPAQQDQPLRFCPMCDAMIPISKFGTNRAAKDGLNRYCRPHIRQKVNEFRLRHKGYRQAEYRRKCAALGAVRENETREHHTRPAPTTIDIVFKYLEENGEATQKQIHNATRISLSNIDIALTELLSMHRSIGTRALTHNARIYFRL